MLRGRRRERREERRRDGGVHSKMRQRLVSIGDDFWIETDSGELVYKVDGKRGETRNSQCAPCAQKARRLRMQQCAEGWHLEEDPLHGDGTVQTAEGAAGDGDPQIVGP